MMKKALSILLFAITLVGTREFNMSLSEFKKIGKNSLFWDSCTLQLISSNKGMPFQVQSVDVLLC